MAGKQQGPSSQQQRPSVHATVAGAKYEAIHSRKEGARRARGRRQWPRRAASQVHQHDDTAVAHHKQQRWAPGDQGLLARGTSKVNTRHRPKWSAWSEVPHTQRMVDRPRHHPLHRPPGPTTANLKAHLYRAQAGNRVREALKNRHRLPPLHVPHWQRAVIRPRHSPLHCPLRPATLTQVTLSEWPSRTVTCTPRSTSQTRSVPSFPPDTSRFIPRASRREKQQRGMWPRCPRVLTSRDISSAFCRRDPIHGRPRNCLASRISRCLWWVCGTS